MTCYALIDCNNFFASCERVFRPDLATRPVIVMSNNDGCVIARSNEVRALDIPMGVPLFKVRDIVRAHNVTLFSANFELYGDISQRILTLLREETPLIEAYSIDENFVDLSQLPIEDQKVWARRVKDRVFREIGVPVSIGMGPTKTLAKVASTFAKTHGNGTWVIESDEERRDMLARLPIEDVWGIGWRTAPKLKDKGVSMTLQLIETGDAWLRQQFNITGMKMIDELRGIPRLSFGDSSAQRKSIMRSRSFGHKIRDRYQVESAVATFTAQAAARLRAQDSVCGSISVFIQTMDPETRRKRTTYREVKLPEVTAHTGELIQAALEGLGIIYDEGVAYRKAGVTLHDIRDVGAWQLSMLDKTSQEREGGVQLMNAVDSINRRFGPASVWHGSEARGSAQWTSKRERQSPRYTTRISELPKLYR